MVLSRKSGLSLCLILAELMWLTSEELFYQLGLGQFGDFSELKLQPAPSIRNLLEIVVEVEGSTESSNPTKIQIVGVHYSILSVAILPNGIFTAENCGTTD